MTQGQIADILAARGQLEEALGVYRRELLPAFERLGDVHSRAVTQGRIADILQARGQLDEALRIRQHEELPVYEWLGDVQGLVVARAKLAINLVLRGRQEDGPEIERHLVWAYSEAKRLGLREASQLETLLGALGIEIPKP